MVKIHLYKNLIKWYYLYTCLKVYKDGIGGGSAENCVKQSLIQAYSTATADKQVMQCYSSNGYGKT